MVKHKEFRTCHYDFIPFSYYMLHAHHVVACCLCVPAEAHELRPHRRAIGSLLLVNKEVSSLVSSDPGFQTARRAHFLATFGLPPPFPVVAPGETWYGIEYVDGSRVYLFKNLKDGAMRNGLEEEMVAEHEELRRRGKGCDTVIVHTIDAYSATSSDARFTTHFRVYNQRSGGHTIGWKCGRTHVELRNRAWAGDAGVNFITYD